MTISFDKAAEVDTRQLSRAYLKFVRGGAVERVGDGIKVILQIAEGGTGIADRLEAEVRAARPPASRPRPVAATGPENGSKPRQGTAQPRSAAERHLLAALRQRA